MVAQAVAAEENPLIVAVGEAAFEIWLEFGRATLDVPRSVAVLRTEQILNRLPVRRGASGYSQFMQGVEHLARAIRVAAEVRGLRPAAVRILHGEEFLESGTDVPVGPFETQQLHDPITLGRGVTRSGCFLGGMPGALPSAWTTSGLRNFRAQGVCQVDGRVPAEAAGFFSIACTPGERGVYFGGGWG